MSFVQPANIHVISESLGLKVKDEAALALAPDVEFRLREIVQEGAKFMLHAKRSYLTSEDINNALRLRNVEPLYGFGGPDPVRFLRAVGFPDVFYAEDPEVTVDQAVTSQLPKCPVEVGVVPHWLAIDGIQPAIPENMPLERSRVKRARIDKPKAAGVAGASAQPAAAAQGPKPVAAPLGGGGVTVEDGSGAGTAGAAATLVRAPVKHVVSQELQLYFDRVARLLRGAQQAQQPQYEAQRAQQEPVQRAVLASLACDPGLQPLAPYLVKLLGEGVGNQLKSLPQLQLLLSAARALVSNPHLDLSPYLHQLMPALMTCLVAKRLGAAPGEDHWSIRDQAAGVVAAVCQRYSCSYENIAPRVQKTLLKALQDQAKPLTTHYGAICGLAALGPRVVQLLLLPSLQPYLAMLAPRLLGPDPAAGTAGALAPGRVAGALARQEALRVQGALLAAVAHCVFRFMGPGGAWSPGAGGQDKGEYSSVSHQQQQDQQQPEGTAAEKANGAVKRAKRRHEPHRDRHKGRLAPLPPPEQRALHSVAQQGQHEDARKQAVAATALTAFFPREADGQGREDVLLAARGGQPSNGKTDSLQRIHEQLRQYAAAHPMLSAQGSSGGGSGGAASASVAEAAEAMALARERNQLAEAWREGFDPGTAASEVYRLFGEAVLPYLPGSAISAMQL